MRTPELWEVNQGKRLLKRMHKCNVPKGSELEVLLQFLRTAAAVVAVDHAKGQGATPEAATAAATEAMLGIKTVEATGQTGYDLFQLLVANGASPGRCKAELDKVLFLSGHSIEAPSDSAPSTMFVREQKGGVEIIAVDEAQYIDQETLDRFPQHSIPRENY